MKKLAYCLILVTLILNGCKEDEGSSPNNNRDGYVDENTANTVTSFSPFAWRTAFHEKGIDSDDNLYVFLRAKGNHQITEDYKIITDRDNTLVKLDKDLKEVWQFPGVLPLNNEGAIYLDKNDNIYMTSGVSLAKISKDGNNLSSAALNQAGEALRVDALGNIYTFYADGSDRLFIRKINPNNEIEWSYSLIDGMKYIELSEDEKSLFVYGDEWISSIDLGTGGTEDGKLWTFNYSSNEVAYAPRQVRARSYDGGVVLALHKEGAGQEGIFYYTEIIRLDETGKQVYSKRIVPKPGEKDFYCNGLTVFGDNYYLALNTIDGTITSLGGSGFPSTKAYIIKYDAATGSEVWRQHPRATFNDEFGGSISHLDMDINKGMMARDLIQSRVSGKLWTSFTFEVRPKREESGTDNIRNLGVTSAFGDFKNSQNFGEGGINLFSNITSLSN